MSIEKFSVEKVLSVQRWTNTLFSFTMTRPAHFKFTAGQFARIGLKVGDDLVVRAYSVVSSPFDETLEFFQSLFLMVHLPPIYSIYKWVMSFI
jgi:ferredoxin--NADP+ reductase